MDFSVLWWRVREGLFYRAHVYTLRSDLVSSRTLVCVAIGSQRMF